MIPLLQEPWEPGNANSAALTAASASARDGSGLGERGREGGRRGLHEVKEPALIWQAGTLKSQRGHVHVLCLSFPNCQMGVGKE